MASKRRTHRFIDTKFGEICLLQCFDEFTNEEYCEMYIGDNWDYFIGCIYCKLLDSDDIILRCIDGVFE